MMPDRKAQADPVCPGSAPRRGGWRDEEDAAAAAAFRPLTKEEAQALRAQDPPLSPWRVVGAQVLVGVVLALLVALVTGRSEWSWSLLYGAATVVVPGVLMARGMTSRLSGMNAGTSAVSFMSWELVKIAVSVAMLVLANRIVRPLVWPALLVGLVVCLKVYWVALLWRGHKKS